MKISKRAKSTIKETMKLHGAEVIYQQQEWKVIAYFKWDGFKD